MAETRLTYFPERRPTALVVSHPRSGTHFLMNALAACYGYVSKPWINLDPNTIAVNYYSPRALSNFLLAASARPLANVLKSHHAPEFFAGELPRLSERYAVFYIYRDPVNVMLSCWRFMHRWTWAGPRLPDPLAFARAEPSAGMLRYQKRQHGTILLNWAAHVEGWLTAAAASPGVTLVRYEDLDRRFEDTVQGLAGALGRSPAAMRRPSPNENVVAGGPEDPAGLGVPPDVDGLRALCRATVGDTMTRLGY